MNEEQEKAVAALRECVQAVGDAVSVSCTAYRDSMLVWTANPAVLLSLIEELQAKSLTEAQIEARIETLEATFKNDIARYTAQVKRLWKAVYPGLPKWEPTPEHPQQDFYEAYLESLHAVFEKARTARCQFGNRFTLMDGTWYYCPEDGSPAKPLAWNHISEFFDKYVTP